METAPAQFWSINSASHNNHFLAIPFALSRRINLRHNNYMTWITDTRPPQLIGDSELYLLV